MRRPIAAAAALLVVALGACSRSESGASEEYCRVVVATHEEALTASAQNASGTPRSATAVPSIIAARSAVAPPDLEVAWMAVQKGPGMESDGNSAAQKNRDFEAGMTTIGDYDQSRCGVEPDLALPETVTVR
jgi:hypothetical protein